MLQTVNKAPCDNENITVQASPFLGKKGKQQSSSVYTASGFDSTAEQVPGCIHLRTEED